MSFVRFMEGRSELTNECYEYENSFDEISARCRRTMLTLATPVAPAAFVSTRAPAERRCSDLTSAARNARL